MLHYPKALYRKTGTDMDTRLVSDAAEHVVAAKAGWLETPGEAEAALGTVPSDSTSAPRDPVPADVLDEQSKARAAEVHKASVSALLSRLQDAPVSILEEVKGYEKLNPKPRKSLLEALDALIAKATAPVTTSA